jgi:hypothetical protein
MDATVWRDHIDIFGAGTLRKETWERLLDELKAKRVPSFTPTGKRMFVDESARGRTIATVYRTGAIPDQKIIRILERYGIEASVGSEKSASA